MAALEGTVIELYKAKIDPMDSVRRTHIVFRAALYLFSVKNAVFVNFL